MSVVSFARTGAANQPSPNLWFDCPKERLIQEGNGFFIKEDFLGGAVSATFTSALTVGKGEFGFEGDAATVLSQKAGEVGGFLDIATAATDNNAAALITQPFARIARNSGLSVWAEVRMELGAIADQGVFIGFVEETGLTRDVVADGSATLVGKSLVGFQILNTDTNAVDAVARLGAATVVEMKSIMNPAGLTANGTFKVGLRFDGETTLQLFFDGVRVATYAVPATGFPTAVDMGFIIALKTGTAAAQSIAIDWAQVAYQSRI